MLAELIDRRQGVAGELALYRRDGQLELVVAGIFAMATGESDSERDMIRRGAALAKRPVRQVLIGGLGAGLSAAAALALPGVEGVTVVELEPWVIEWNRTHFAPFNGDALQDPRLKLVAGDFSEALQDVSPGSQDLVAIDTDNGPDWLLRAENAAIYGAEGITACGMALRSGGVLAVWTADPCPALARRLHAVLGPVSRRDYLRLSGDRELLNTVYYAVKPEETHMLGDMALAKGILAAGAATVVAVKDGAAVAEGHGTGLAPLLANLDRLQGAAVADRVVGRAAALLLVHAGAACVHGSVMSEPGKVALDEHGCPASWNTLVPHIRNRMGTGLCPMEERALGMRTPAEAYRAFVLRE